MAEVVTEADLRAELFCGCCGQPWLRPMACPQCGRLIVFCIECEAAFANLADLDDICFDVNHSDPARPRFTCPQCGFGFAYIFSDEDYPASRDQWIAAGFGNLLRDVTS